MGLKCDNCDVEFRETNYKLLKEKDVGTICPICGKAKVYLEGYCPDCSNVIEVTQYDEYNTYRCSNCREQVSIDQILSVKPV